MFSKLFLVTFISLIISLAMGQSSVEVKRTRRPNRFDHLLCKQKYTGFGVRSSAVLNYSGEICKTYCRIINRVNRTSSFTENISPNNIRCGPLGARCVEGVCTQGSGGSSSGAITDVVSNRKGRPIKGNRIDSKRLNPTKRRGSSSPQKTSISTIETTEFSEKETESETSTDAVIIETEVPNDNKNAKIIFPND